MKSAPKSSISGFLMQQALDCLHLALQAREKKLLITEIQQTMNVFLVLGITVEGIINEIGEQFLDSWTWSEVERVSTPLKWQIISGIKKAYEPSKEPLQTIIDIQRIRNKIAHPKLKELDEDIILVSTEGVVMFNPKNEDVLPSGDFTVYKGYGKLIKEFNGFSALFKMRKVLEAINNIIVLFELDGIIDWHKYISHSISSIDISKNEFDK